jgi:cytochrome-b5 reductase
LCPPGQCQFGDEFVKVSLLENIPVSETSFSARFELPDKNKSLGLSTCACILAGTEIDEEMVVRPYTPISTNADIGTFDLLIKKYPGGKMSTFLGNMKPSDGPVVGFKHIPFNVKIQYPFNKEKHAHPKFIAMICGGTGITPMIQALHAILGDSESNIEKVHLLYGSRTFDDILGRQMIDDWCATHPKFSVTHVLSHEEKDVEPHCKKGFIDRALLESTVPPASEGDNVLIFICGPPVMYDILCGPRDDKTVTGVLGDMGYSSDQVYKF